MQIKKHSRKCNRRKIHKHVLKKDTSNSQNWKESLLVRSARRARQGPWVKLLATSSSQNPTIKAAIARTFFSPLSPNNQPISAEKPMINTAIMIDTAPSTINGRRRLNRLVHRSLMCPTKGWTSKPESGPQSHIMLAHAWGIPSSCTYGVSSDSCKAHPNCIPPATDATRRSSLNGTLSRAGSRLSPRLCRVLCPLWPSGIVELSVFLRIYVRYIYVLSSVCVWEREKWWKERWWNWC